MSELFQIGPVPSVDDVEFVERLGSGLGKGRFRARFLNSGAQVSLLFENPDLDRGTFIDWGRRLEGVDHAAVPPVRRVEEVLEPAFVAFEYIEGQNLEARVALRGSGLPELDALSIVLQAAGGVRAAHRNGVAHGALSPRSLILVAREDTVDAVRLVGWTPLSQEVDPEAARKADIAALGALLYTCITGVLPPSAQKSDAAANLEGEGGSFDEILMGWVEVERDVKGMGKPALEALTDATRFEDVDAFIDELLPHFEAELGRARAKLARSLGGDREFQAEVERMRERQKELETKLRFVREWLRANADHIEERESSLAERSRRERGLSNLEMELSMLLDRAVKVDPNAVAPPDQAPPAVAAMDDVAAEHFEELKRGDPPSRSGELPPPPTPEPEPPLRDPPQRMGGATMLLGLVGAVAIGGGLAAWMISGDRDDVPPPPQTQAQPAAASNQPQSDAQVMDAQAPDAAAKAPDAAANVPDAAAPDAQADEGLAFDPIAVEEDPIGEPPEGMVVVPSGPVYPTLDAEAQAAAIKACEAEVSKPLHKVECNPERFPTGGEAVDVPAFFIDRYEVSQGDYDACRRDRKCNPLWLTWETDEQPATGVTQEMARIYCEWKGRRLPTADEWLRAARGDDQRLFTWGEGPIQEGKKRKDWRANVGKFGSRGGVAENRDGYRYAAPVDAYKGRNESPFGATNMLGNVREWTGDVKDEQGVIMGGGWHDMQFDQRLTRRELRAADKYANDIGFRCAADPVR